MANNPQFPVSGLAFGDPTAGPLTPVSVANPLPTTGSGGGGGGAVTIANGADAVEGTLSDAAITTDANGSVSGKLRGLVKILADVWDSANHWLRVLTGSEGPVTPGTVAGKSTLVGVQHNTTPPTVGDGQQVALQCDTAGNLLVNVETGTITGGNPAAGATGAAVPADADYQGVKVGANLVGVTGSTVASHTSADTNLQLVGGAAFVLGPALAAASLPVTGNGTPQLADVTAQVLQPDMTTITIVNGVNPQPSVNVQGMGSCLVCLSGTYGPATCRFEVSPSPNGTNDATAVWFTTQGSRIDSNTVQTSSGSLTSLKRAWLVDCIGANRVRLNTTAGSLAGAVLTITPLATPVRACPSVNVANSTSTTGADVNVVQVGGVAVALGQTTMAGSFPVALASDQSAIPVSQSGGWTVSVSGTVAENVSQWGGVATSLGQKVMASSVPVTIASDQTVVPASQSGSWTVAVTQVTSPWVENVSQWGGNNVTTGGVNGSVGVGGLAGPGTTAAGNPVLAGAVFNTSQPTVSNGQVVDLQATNHGGLIVATGTDTFTVTANAGTNLNTSALALEAGNLASILAALDDGQETMANSLSVTIASDQSSFPVTIAAGSAVIGHVITDTGSTTAVTGTVATNVTQLGGTSIAVNTGNSSAGTQRVVLATDQPNLTTALNVALAANQSVNVAQVNGVTTAVNTGNSSTGTQRVVLASDQPVVAVTGQPGTANGLTNYFYISSGAANQDSAAIKGSAGQLYEFELFNTTTSLRFVKFYDKASGATSSDVPVLVVALPGITTGSGAVKTSFCGRVFASGICHRITTGAANNDTGAASTNDVLISCGYK